VGGEVLFRNIGPLELGLILVIVLLIFGAGKLPQIGRAFGDTIREFKKSVGDKGDKGEKAEEPEKKEK